MYWLSWVLLGLLQGLTEFLPVSSSGHLVLAQALLGLDSPGILLEVTVHVGTAAAVVVLFARDLAAMLGALARWPLGRRASRRGDREWRVLAATLVLATGVTAAVGLGLEPVFRRAFEAPLVAAVMLLVTGVVLFWSRRLTGGHRPLEAVGPADALVVGLAQGLAIFPGLSRSGMTIVGALSRGLEGAAAARFSFLLSLPAIAGAALVEAVGADGLGGALQEAGLTYGLLLAFGASFLAGLAAMVLLTSLVRRGRLHRFAWYCWVAGGAALLWLILAG